MRCKYRKLSSILFLTLAASLVTAFTVLAATTTDISTFYELGTNPEEAYQVFKIEVEDIGLIPVEQFTVRYDGNYTGAPAQVIYTVDKGEQHTVPFGLFSRFGFMFDAYNTQENGRGLRVNVGTSFEVYADTTLYAQWRSFS